MQGPAPKPADRAARWRVFADTGGTFTDCLAIDPSGRTLRGKVLSSGALRATVLEQPAPDRLVIEAGWLEHHAWAAGATLRAGDAAARIASITPERPRRAAVRLDAPLPTGRPGIAVELTTGEPAPVLAARLLTGTPPTEALPLLDLHLATTRGTNALLERSGGPVAFFVTEGFGDLLVIGDQTRPDLFALPVFKPPPLHDHVAEVPERLGPDGEVRTPLNADAVRAAARGLAERGVRTAAVALIHSWRDPTHERLVRDILLEEGFEHASLSSDLGSALGFLARAETAVVNAFLAQVIERYLDAVSAPLSPGSTLLIMTSAGGLIDRAGFQPKDSLLSGPAGGVVGAAAVGAAADNDRIISFDMGGTSTDVARGTPTPDRRYLTRVGDARILSPSVAVETVAAGGGSICSVGRSELRVGPESAGADPGPACYGRGGPLTLTDCNLLLGRLEPARFAVPLDEDTARARALETLAEARDRVDAGLDLEPLLAGFIRIADQRMAEAVKRTTVRRGEDPREHALVAFGGAGPQHACAIARQLDIRRVLIPADAGLLSAYGLAVAPLERTRDAPVLKTVPAALDALGPLLDALERDARSDLPTGADTASARAARTIELRFAGQDDVIEIDAEPHESIEQRFLDRYAARFGYLPTGAAVEVVTARATVRVPRRAGPTHDPNPDAPSDAHSDPISAAAQRCRPIYTDRWTDGQAIEWSAVAADPPLAGPALITSDHCTVFLEPGWSAALHPTGALVLSPAAAAPTDAGRPRAVEVELAVGKLTAIAEEMGERLRAAAISTNVKQRRDFSCAILDDQGRLLVNAPHVPVHLGSMGVCVRAVRDLLGPDLRRSTIVSNHPAFGGSHLPDVTVIQPVHSADGALLGYAAARAHHAEIGGIAPGSMAPEATRLSQEGVVIPPTALGVQGSIDWDDARALFHSGPHPSRDPETNLRDLAAAVHAVWSGARALGDLAKLLGSGGVQTLGETVRTRAALALREALARLPEGERSHVEPVRGGGPIAVRIRTGGERLLIDFEGSGPVHPGCLNATPAIVTSAVIYVLRLLVEEDLPLNEGLLDPVDLRIPEGLLSPRFAEADGPAVAGGNVEISQLVVESLLTALGRSAQSQGTMNNVTFGNDALGFYETLAGGCGAAQDRHGRWWPGASAVHSHMTNTSITDVEILESRYPVWVTRTAVRRGSGGPGDIPGGDGLERWYRFLTPMRVGVLTGRARAPSGLLRGLEGLSGAYLLKRPGLETRDLGDSTVSVQPGDEVRVFSPGGGSYGF